MGKEKIDRYFSVFFIGRCLDGNSLYYGSIGVVLKKYPNCIELQNTIKELNNNLNLNISITNIIELSKEDYTEWTAENTQESK